MKKNGITLISFDIDDTIEDNAVNMLEAWIPLPVYDKARKLMRELKAMGFKVALLTNGQEKVAKQICSELKADGYIYSADKPEPHGFKELADKFAVKPSQIAHVGNDIIKDTGGGNNFGVTTCLVRRNGFFIKGVKAIGAPLGIKTKGQKIRKALKERGLWRKHHKNHHGDQYYQLGEEPGYKRY